MMTPSRPVHASEQVSCGGTQDTGDRADGLGEEPATLTSLPTVSVVIAAFTIGRWGDLREAVSSVRAQTVPVLETIVVIDHNPGLLALARRELSGVTVIPNGGSQGASGSRNTGVAASHGEVVAFLDDDAVASPCWLEPLLSHFAETSVVGVGGRLNPLWATSRPRWFPPEFYWAVGASYQGMPDSAEPVRNVWSGNMVIRRQVFDLIGGFRDGFGKAGSRSRPEDTDLCLRAAGSQLGGTWIYEPAGAASHRVPAERSTLRFFVNRCYNEGWGKAALAALNGTVKSMSSERSYTTCVLPGAFARGVRQASRGNASGGLRSFAIAAGFTAAAAGFLVGQTAALVQAAGIRHRLTGTTRRRERAIRKGASRSADSR
jgi:GT2 family glycosyltransferase